MATIPRIYADRKLDIGSVVQYPTGDPVGAAVERAGQQGQAVANRILSEREQAEKFKAIAGLSVLEQGVLTEIDRETREAKDGGVGMETRILETFDKKASEYMSQIPPGLREQFKLRIDAQKAEFTRTAKTAEYKVGRNFEVSTLANDSLNAEKGVSQYGPQSIEAYAKSLDELVDNSSKLNPQEKADLKAKNRRDLEAAAFKNVALNDPAAAQEIVRGWGIGRGSQVARERTALSFFAQKGLSTVAAAAVVGRLGHESGMRTDARNPGDGSDGSDSIGMGQWNAGRADDLKRFSQAKGTPVTDANTQLEFVWKELNTSERKALSMLQSARTPEQAARAMVEFERPKGWQANGNYRNEDVSGWSDQLARAKRLMGEHVEPGDAGGVRSSPNTTADSRFSNLSADQRFQLAGMADQQFRRQTAESAAATTEQYNQRYNALQTDIIDGKASLADVQLARQAGWLKEADAIDKLTDRIEKRDRDLANTQGYHTAPSDYPWNPVSTEDKNKANAGFVSLGKNMPAMQAVVEKTGIVPPDAAVSMRGALVSNDPRRVMEALTTATNLMAGKRGDAVFAGVEGRSDIENAAVAFRYNTEHLGYTAQQAADKYIKEQSLEFKNDLTKKRKTEDVDAIVKKEMQKGTLISEIQKAFNEDVLDFSEGMKGVGRPTVEFSPQARQQAQEAYAALIKDHYLVSTDDINVAKEQAIKQLKINWGVSFVNGAQGGNVMRFPPDKARAYAGIPDVGSAFAQQAIEEIKAATGKDIDRRKLIVLPTPGGQTSRAYTSGQEPPYTLIWMDENNNQQMLQRGTGFVLDGSRARAAVSEQRRLGLEASQKESVPGQGEAIFTKGGVLDQYFNSGADIPLPPKASMPPPIKPGDFMQPKRPRQISVIRDETGRLTGLREE